MYNFIFLFLFISSSLFSDFDFSFNLIPKMHSEDLKKYYLLIESSRTDGVISVDVESEEELPSCDITLPYSARLVDYVALSDGKTRKRISFCRKCDYLPVGFGEQLCFIFDAMQEHIFNSGFLSLGLAGSLDYARLIGALVDRLDKFFIQNSYCVRTSNLLALNELLSFLNLFAYKMRLNEFGEKMYSYNDEQEGVSEQELLSLSEELLHDLLWDIFKIWAKRPGVVRHDPELASGKALNNCLVFNYFGCCHQLKIYELVMSVSNKDRFC